MTEVIFRSKYSSVLDNSFVSNKLLFKGQGKTDVTQVKLGDILFAQIHLI